MGDSLRFFLSDQNVAAVSTLCLLYILLLLLFIAILLLRKQRSIANIMLFIGMVLMLTDQLASALHQSTSTSVTPLFGFGRASLMTVSFIILNIAVLRLYKRISPIMLKRFVILTCSVLILIGSSTLFIADNQLNTLAWMLTAMQLYTCFLCYIWVAPRVLQYRRYQLGMIAFALSVLSVFVNIVYYDGTNQWLIAGKHLFALAYYTTLFLLFFERILDQLQTTYRSSITDGLTGLYNRRYMYQRMSTILQGNVQAAILFCDIDNFKLLNDSHGHQIADEALKRTALILQKEIEDIGIVGRFGGEELIALIYEARCKPGSIAEKIRKRVEAEAGVTISIGYTTYRRHLSVDQFVQEADQAMYYSKQHGKNRVTAYRDMKNTHTITSVN